MTEITYRGYQISVRSILGNEMNISKDGEYVDHVLGDVTAARYAIDAIIEENR